MMPQAKGNVRDRGPSSMTTVTNIKNIKLHIDIILSQMIARPSEKLKEKKNGPGVMVNRLTCLPIARSFWLAVSYFSFLFSSSIFLFLFFSLWCESFVVYNKWNREK